MSLPSLFNVLEWQHMQYASLQGRKKGFCQICKHKSVPICDESYPRFVKAPVIIGCQTSTPVGYVIWERICRSCPPPCMSVSSPKHMVLISSLGRTVHFQEGGWEGWHNVPKLIYLLSHPLKQEKAGEVKTIGSPARQVFHGSCNLTHQLDKFILINNRVLHYYLRISNLKWWKSNIL